MPRASEKAVPEKLGRQTPTAAVVLPYTTTHGQEAIDLYNTTGRTAQQWQQLLLYDILAENEDGLWYIPNSATASPAATARMRSPPCGSCTVSSGARTSCTQPTARPPVMPRGSAVQPAGQGQDRIQIIRASGRESIRLKSGEGRIEFRTRSSKGGLGEGFDLLIIDEAQEYTDDQESALKYVVTDSRDPADTLLRHTAHAGLLRHGVPQTAKRGPAGRNAEHRLGRVERGAADRPP